MFGGGMGGSGAPEQKERQGSPKGPGVDMSKKKIIIPLTISMLENAERDQNEALVIDGVEISNVPFYIYIIYIYIFRFHSWEGLWK